MNLKVNNCNPSFGVVTRRAITLAKSLGTKDIDKLVESQKDNLKYNVNATQPDLETTMEDFCVEEYQGYIIKRFKSLMAACIYASELDKAAKEKGA